MIDLKFDPYHRNYVITMEVSPELAERLEKDPDARKALADALQSEILSMFSITRPVTRASAETR